MLASKKASLVTESIKKCGILTARHEKKKLAR